MTQPTPPAGLSAAQIAGIIALIKAQAKVRQQLSQTAINAATQAFGHVTDWWSSAQIDKAITAALRLIQPAQRQAARSADAYLARTASIMSGRPVRPAGAIDVTALRRDITQQVIEDLAHDRAHAGYVVLGEHDPDHRRVNATDQIDAPLHQVIPEPARSSAERIARQRGDQPPAQTLDPAAPYGRIADQYRYQVVARDTPNERARQYALTRVAAVAQTDVTLAVREQYRKTLSKTPNVKGFRRILHPELSETGPCGLCVVAADRVYRIEHLLPIHDRCCCEVLPIIGHLDPGVSLNRSDLDAIYEAAGSTGGSKRERGALKKIRVALVEHGELGPWLTDADQHWRGPKQVAVTRTVDKRVRLKHQLDELEHRFAVFTRRQLDGEDVDKPLQWQANRIAGLRKELAGLQ